MKSCARILATLMLFAPVSGATLANPGQDLEEWEDKISGITWVAYSPPTANPPQGLEAARDAIRQDLSLLRKAKFSGLVTYTAAGSVGREVPTLAQALGFEGVILGVWDPLSKEELAAAKQAGKHPLVVGFCVGNEGLDKRYRMEDLSTAIEYLKEETGRPVATTEEIDDYGSEALLQLGDWVFPNAHPYFHSRVEPDAAVRWTIGAYEDLQRRAKRLVVFKEVGLPTAGDTDGMLSEAAQEQYYKQLAASKVRFVYFEAFDQPWKTHLPVEPHWGIFRSDRTPKRLAQYLLAATHSVEGTSGKEFFHIYLDADSPTNHFKPTGYMGDCGDIHIDETFEENPRSGKTCLRVVYDAKGKGPNECPYSPPCRWAGVYWQYPPNNWGRDSHWKGKGFNLGPYSRLVFWARADKRCRIQFKVGGIDEPYGDSLTHPRSITAKLNKTWQKFEVNLRGADLRHIIGGFCWVTNWDTNPDGATFYLDDIRFEQ